MDGDKPEHLLEAIPVMGCYCDIIGVRSFARFENRDFDYQETILNQFIQYSGRPVFSMEAATRHPLQSFADLITIKAAFCVLRRVRRLELKKIIINVLLRPNSTYLKRSFLISNASARADFKSPMSCTQVNFFMFSIINSLLYDLSFNCLLFTVYSSLLHTYYHLVCPFPSMTHLYEVISSNPMGPRACNFWVLIPISAPEFLDYKMAVKTVKSFEDALRHIQENSSRHSECIVTENKERAALFTKIVDAACIYTNVSTAFTITYTDSACFGIINNICPFTYISKLIKVSVANTGPCFNDRDFCIVAYKIDKVTTSSGDNQIDITYCI